MSSNTAITLLKPSTKLTDWRLQSVSEGTIQRWLKNFVSHDLELQDGPDCGQKSSLNNKELMIVMEKQEARY